MDKAEFRACVQESLDAVPEPFRQYLDTVDVVILAAPTRTMRREMRLKPREVLYGLYDGVTVPERLRQAGGASGILPSLIYLFRRAHLKDYPDPDELKAEIRRTLFHELAHHFGIDDDRLEELGAY